MDPRVTIIMATYNWSAVLPYSIGSALEQRFTDFELLVIGDGCTDDSERVVSEIKDPRVRWINIPRVGHQSGPNNEGLRQARGAYIAYLGHDDLWLPHHLAQLVAALDAGADLAHSSAAMVRLDGTAHPWTAMPSVTMHRRSMTERMGGWRNYWELTVLPEEDFYQRARDGGMSLTFVKRLTCIKFPAGWRRDVYRERPSHEQAAWLERIRSEPDLETNLLIDMAYAPLKPPPVVVRIAALLLRPWRWPEAILRRIPRKGAVIRKMIRFKGVKN